MFLNGLRILGGALLGYFYGDQGFGQDNQNQNNFGQIGFFIVIAIVIYLLYENLKKKWDTV